MHVKRSVLLICILCKLQAAKWMRFWISLFLTFALRIWSRDGNVSSNLSYCQWSRRGSCAARVLSLCKFTWIQIIHYFPHSSQTCLIKWCGFVLLIQCVLFSWFTLKEWKWNVTTCPIGGAHYNMTIWQTQIFFK